MTSTPIKCLVIGDGCVGKTSLLRTFIHKTYFSSTVTTTYDEYITQASTTNGTRVDLLLCDTTAMDAYDDKRPTHYANTEVIILCFSVVDQSTKENVYERWLPEIRHYCPYVPIILVGTKVDLREDNPPFVERHRIMCSTYKQGLVIAKDIDAVSYFECSALTGEGIPLVFKSVATCGVCERSQSNMRQLECKCSIL